MSFGEGDLHVENGELRELARDMLRVLLRCCTVHPWRTEDSCEGCPHYKGCCAAMGDLRDRAAGLGIEVDR